MSFSPQQCRAARAWVGWTQDELAERANVAVTTVANFERGVRIPFRNNLKALEAAFVGYGVQFVNGGLVAGVVVAGIEAKQGGEPWTVRIIER